MNINKVLAWWGRNAWKVRIRIYSAFVFLPRLFVSIIEAIELLYEKVMMWLLWKALNFIFRRRVKEEKS